MKITIPFEVKSSVVSGYAHLISTNVSSASDPAAYAGGTTYAAAAQVTYSETIYESLQASNTGHTPGATGSETWWAEVGTINTMAMFDRRTSSVTSNTNTIDVVVECPDSIISTLALRGLYGNSVTVTQRDETSAIIYQETQQLLEPVDNWYDWLYAPIRRSEYALFTGFLPYRSGSTIEVVIDATGGTARCGLFCFGPSLEYGGAEYGASDGIEDYSRVETDEWGVRDIIQRDYSDVAEFQVFVENSSSGAFRNLLAERRAQPTLVTISDSRSDLQYYGLVSFRRTMQFTEVDVFALTVKGFT